MTPKSTAKSSIKTATAAAGAPAASPGATQPAASMDRDLRLRNQFFPDADNVIFKTEQKGYTPLPILLRKLLPHITAPELRALMYLYMRSSKYRICYPTLDEIAGELGINRKNLSPHLKALEKKRLIRTHSAGGRKYFLMLDPRIAIEELVQNGAIKDEELFMLNELCQELKQPQFRARAARAVTVRS